MIFLKEQGAVWFLVQVMGGFVISRLCYLLSYCMIQSLVPYVIFMCQGFTCLWGTRVKKHGSWLISTFSSMHICCVCKLVHMYAFVSAFSWTLDEALAES
jgi:hypothetical protein